MANETVLFKRGDSATITSTPVTDGQILFDTSGNGKMYLDNGTDRLEMGGAITVDASLSKTSTNAIQNKAVTGNILNSLAEVSAATQQNTIAGALALKEVNSSLEKLTTYSTEEKIVGTWVDGSIIYQKTFVDVNLSGLTNVDISSLSIKTVINIEAMGSFDNNSVGSLNYNDNNYVGFIWLNPEKTTLSINEKANKMIKATFTLKYTKK